MIQQMSANDSSISTQIYAIRSQFLHLRRTGSDPQVALWVLCQEAPCSHTSCPCIRTSYNRSRPAAHTHLRGYNTCCLTRSAPGRTSSQSSAGTGRKRQRMSRSRAVHARPCSRVRSRSAESDQHTRERLSQVWLGSRAYYAMHSRLTLQHKGTVPRGAVG